MRTDKAVEKWSGRTQPELIVHVPKASRVVLPVPEEIQLSVLTSEENLKRRDEGELASLFSGKAACFSKQELGVSPSSRLRLCSCHSKPGWEGSPRLRCRWCKDQRSSLRSVKSERSPAAVCTAGQLKGADSKITDPLRLYEQINVSHLYRWAKKCFFSILTRGKDGGDEATPLWSGNGLQADAVLCGAGQLGHAVGGGCGAQHHLLQTSIPSQQNSTPKSKLQISLLCFTSFTAQMCKYLRLHKSPAFISSTSVWCVFIIICAPQNIQKCID